MKVQLNDYIRARIPGNALHGIALCSIDGADLEPVQVYRNGDGGVRLLNGPLALPGGLPQLDPRHLVGGRALGSLSDAEYAEIEALVRQRLAVRIEVTKYHAYPVSKSRVGVVIGAVQCELDGAEVEPLLVVRDRKRRIVVRRVDELPALGGGVVDLRPLQYGIRYEPPQFAPALQAELTAAVQRAVRGAP